MLLLLLMLPERLLPSGSEEEAEQPEQQSAQEVKPSTRVPVLEMPLVPISLPAVPVKHDVPPRPALQHAAPEGFVIVESGALRVLLAGCRARVRPLHLRHGSAVLVSRALSCAALRIGSGRVIVGVRA